MSDFKRASDSLKKPLAADTLPVDVILPATLSFSVAVLFPMVTLLLFSKLIPVSVP
jgi:hypothetical protein